MTTIINRVALLFIAITSFTSCQRNQSEPQTLAPTSGKETASDTITLSKEQVEVSGIEFTSMEKRSLDEVVQTNGYLRLPPQDVAQVSVFMPGMITSISVKEEDFIKKGQPLAYMKHPDFTKLQESYLTAVSTYKVAELEYTRQKELFASNVGAGKAFQQSEAVYKSEKAKLLSLDDQLKQLGISSQSISEDHIVTELPIVSPLSGYVTHINTNTGTIAQPGTVLFEVINDKSLRGEIIVYEKDLYKIKAGQEVTLLLVNQNDRTIHGKVSAIGKTLAEQTKSTIAYVEIGNKPTLSLTQGIYVNALIDVGTQKVLTAPSEAIIKSDGKDFIFQYLSDDNNRSDTVYYFKMIEVKPGISQGGFTAVTILGEPIGAIDKIVSKGAFFVLSKRKEGENQDE